MGQGENPSNKLGEKLGDYFCQKVSGHPGSR
jgi:hypothetical protein